MAVHIPRRPEVPGAPGLELPRPRLLGNPYDELPLLPSWDEEEAPTKPYASEPPKSGRVLRRKTLSVPNLSPEDAAQLAGIIAAWESSEAGDRALLAQFAKRLGRSRQK